jgi:FPC/CPF motif-containing protein YcgG
MDEPRRSSDATLVAVQRLKAWIFSGRFACLGARAAARQGVLQIVLLGPIDRQDSALKAYEALRGFVSSGMLEAHRFATLVVVFQGSVIPDELDWENAFWRLVQELHHHDAALFDWAADTSSDPESRQFQLSLCGHPFFLIGMHPQSSRISRRAPWPAVAFNSHRNFALLKAEGTFPGLQRRIQSKEILIQGSLNPNLAGFGDAAQSRQYSGRAVEQTWRCPFTALGERPEHPSTNPPEGQPQSGVTANPV